MERTLTRNMRALSGEMFTAGDMLLGAPYTREELQAQLKIVKSVQGTSAAPMETAYLMEMMNKECIFLKSDRKYADLSPEVLYKVLTEDDAVPIKRDKKMLVKSLEEKYSSFPRRENIAERTVKTLALPELKQDGRLKDSVFLTVIKQFEICGIDTASLQKVVLNRFPVTHKKKVERVDKVRQVLQCLNDENAYDILSSLNGTGEELVLLAENFAGGSVIRNSQGAHTKKDLYRLAFAFRMKYYTEEEKQTPEYDVRNDIEKNLFEDFYTASVFDELYIVRLSDKSGERRGVAETLSEGIDFKNPAEVIFLYYLRKEPPTDKKDNRIDRAREMLGSCLAQWKHFDGVVAPDDAEYHDTYYYKTEKVHFDLPEKEFEQEIVENFYRPEYRNYSNVSSFWKHVENQYTACEEYKRLLKRLCLSVTERVFASSAAFDDCEEGLVEDVSVIYNAMWQVYFDIHNREEKPLVSRNKLIAAYLLAFLTVYSRDYAKPGSYQQLLQDFCYGRRDSKNRQELVGLQTLLETCRYQPFTPKQLFDVIVFTVLCLNLMQ